MLVSLFVWIRVPGGSQAEVWHGRWFRLLVDIYYRGCH